MSIVQSNPYLHVLSRVRICGMVGLLTDDSTEKSDKIPRTMTISKRVHKQLFVSESPEPNQQTLIRIPPTVVVQYNERDTNPDAKPRRRRSSSGSTGRRANLWSVEEHERFLEGLQRYPRGPWKQVAAVVGTKTVRQTMTHAQKYRQKIDRLTKRDREQSDQGRMDLLDDDASRDLTCFVDELLMDNQDLLADMDELSLDLLNLPSGSVGLETYEFSFDHLLSEELT